MPLYSDGQTFVGCHFNTCSEEMPFTRGTEAARFLCEPARAPMPIDSRAPTPITQTGIPKQTELVSNLNNHRHMIRGALTFALITVNLSRQHASCQRR